MNPLTFVPGFLSCIKKGGEQKGKCEGKTREQGKIPEK
jgi:hypothetical protein